MTSMGFQMDARRRRALALGLLLSALGGLTACEDFLRAENPGAVEVDQLNSPQYIPLMVNGVVGEFQRMLPLFIYYNALFSDELRNHHVFFEEPLIDRRAVAPENGTYSFFYYVPLHRARFLADTMTSRLKILLADSASRDIRVARVLAYAAYTYIFLAENLCESPIDGSRPYQPAELLEDLALPRFEEAITVASAAKAVAGAPAATIASADSIIAFARVGTARTYLDLGDKPNAAAFAQAFLSVITDSLWTFRAYYSENSSVENNGIAPRLIQPSSQVTGSVSNTPFEFMRDRRVPRPAAPERTQNGLTVFVPNSPRAFSSYNGDAAVSDSLRRIGADFTRAASIRIASWREARYILAEAQGLNAGNLLFLNSQRRLSSAADSATLVAPTDAEYLTALRDQRRREFYLDAHRLGDLRRYKAQYGVDEFQRGLYPGTTTGLTYDDRECWPLTLAEINGNPNVPKP